MTTEASLFGLAGKKAMVIGGVRLLEKTGGRSGTYRAAEGKR